MEMGGTGMKNLIEWLRSKERKGMSAKIRDLKEALTSSRKMANYWRNRALHAENYIAKLSDEYRYGKSSFNQEYPQ